MDLHYNGGDIIIKLIHSKNFVRMGGNFKRKMAIDVYRDFCGALSKYNNFIREYLKR